MSFSNDVWQNRALLAETKPNFIFTLSAILTHLYFIPIIFVLKNKITEKKIIMIQDEDKNVWFKGFNVASILGYSNKEKAIKVHVDEDEKKKLKELMPTQNGWDINFQPHTFFINESRE